MSYLKITLKDNRSRLPGVFALVNNSGEDPLIKKQGCLEMSTTLLDISVTNRFNRYEMAFNKIK